MSNVDEVKKSLELVDPELLFWSLVKRRGNEAWVMEIPFAGITCFMTNMNPRQKKVTQDFAKEVLGLDLKVL